MKTLILVTLNLALLSFLVFLILRRDTLSYYRDGRIWLTWLAVAVITLMDELTSVFCAPAELSGSLVRQRSPSYPAPWVS